MNDEKKNKPSKIISVQKIIQLSAAVLLTLALLIVYPAYGWFSSKLQLARYEKINVPNALYITAARREDSKYLEMDNIDITANWTLDASGVSAGKKTYQDYVFTVAGDYISAYTLQLAHTTNNNYSYEIFEATVTDVRPTGANVALGRDYVEYTLSNTYDPAILGEYIPDEVYGNASPGTMLFYSVKKDSNGTPISLNAVNYTEANEANLTASSYTVGGDTVEYRGHYLNWSNYFTALGTGFYHNETYGSELNVGDGSDTKVQTHAEPLYWQARGIPVAGGEHRRPFFHEYILRISWTVGNRETDPKAEYKDTDIIYISVKAGS